ncbi:DEAD/DEAH box helicase [Aeromicrobium sp. UC242_57]|uniref:DEAD/DEAH box helicase n=1 Tax=Aeromicrobium sp. UC242_57 TaxID=3374624 RepID=UPI0037A157CC
MPEIADALEDVGIIEAFPIQEMTLGVALMGTDLIGQARTGTGKTLAFGIPVIQRTVAPHDADYDQVAAGKPQALIVAPTRELAIQVASDIAVASKRRGTPQPDDLRRCPLRDASSTRSPRASTS